MGVIKVIFHTEAEILVIKEKYRMIRNVRSKEKSISSMSRPLDVCKLLILLKLGALIEGKIWKDYRVRAIDRNKERYK